MRSRPVKRIKDVRALRIPPVRRGRRPPRPSGAAERYYREINNFYTATVYEKGAEVIAHAQDS